MIDAANVSLYLNQPSHVGLQLSLDYEPEVIGKIICGMLNRFGGEIIIGANEHKQFSYTKEEQVATVIKEVITLCATEDNLQPAMLVKPRILSFESYYLILLTLPPAPSLTCFKGEAYLREQENTRLLTKVEQLQVAESKAQLYIENKVFPYASIYDLQLERLPDLKHQAATQSGLAHWLNLKDHDLLLSAGLYLNDLNSGKKGVTLGGILMLGKNELIAHTVPNYASLLELKTKAQSQIQNIACNLVTAQQEILNTLLQNCESLTGKLNSFKQELLRQLLNECITNFLIHRDYTSIKPSKVILTQEGVKFINPSTPLSYGVLQDKSDYFALKNPQIEKFFKALGLASLNGSGLPKIITLSRQIFNTTPYIAEGEYFTLKLDFYPADPMAQGSDLPSERTASSNQKADEKPNNQKDSFRPIEPNGFSPGNNSFKSNFIKNIQDIKLNNLSYLTTSSDLKAVNTDQTEQDSILNQNDNLDQTDLTLHSDFSDPTNAVFSPNNLQSNPDNLRGNQDFALQSEHRGSLHLTPPENKRRRLTIKENNSDWLPFADPQIELLNLIKMNPNLTNVELASTLGWSTGRIKFYVGKLKKAGAISRVGTDRKGYWKVF